MAASRIKITMEEASLQKLVASARSALAHAYAPYSGFTVGAAVVDEQGRIFQGANVENASYGLTMCAERVAIFSAVAAGARRITAVAIAAGKLDAVSPCGACRQVMSEFCEPDTPVLLGADTSKKISMTVSELLPYAFTPDALRASR